MQLLVSAFQGLFFIKKKRVRRSRGRRRDLMSKELLMGFYFWRDAHQGLAHPKFKELRDKVSTLIWFSIFRAAKGRLRSKTQSEVFIFFSSVGWVFGGRWWLWNLDLLKKSFFSPRLSTGKPPMCSGELSDSYWWFWSYLKCSSSPGWMWHVPPLAQGKLMQALIGISQLWPWGREKDEEWGGEKKKK